MRDQGIRRRPADQIEEESEFALEFGFVEALLEAVEKASSRLGSGGMRLGPLQVVDHLGEQRLHQNGARREGY